MIRIQQADFDIQTEHKKLQLHAVTGAIVTFTGTVRDFSDAPSATFWLEHYPGMTESVLEKIESEAHARWNILHTTIIHRVGSLKVDDQIVFVGVSSAHRSDAFHACQYIMDILKTEAPFWKKEGKDWVQANTSDQVRAQHWISNKTK